jgi:formate dehydrogenase subunit beta
MKVEATLKVEGDTLKAVRNFLGILLKERIVDFLLVPQEISHGRSLVQTLVKDAAHLDRANPFSPVMPMNSATIVSQLTAGKPGKRLGVVLKPCEIRALIELTKLGQANLEDLVIIGTDCLGTYEVEDYARVIEGMEGAAEEKGARLLAEMRQGTGRPGTGLPISLRTACRMCNLITPPLADITLSLFGAGDEIFISLEDELAKELGLALKETPDRQQAIAQLIEGRTAVREQVFSEFRDKMATPADFADALTTCTRCYACQSACPICYCRVCFFRTETFEPESERYFRWAEREDALRMPTEILLFHLTRLNHIAASCVGCGMCESACPHDLPLTTIFEAVGDGVQKALDYEPGRSLEDEIPTAAFRETGR